MSKKIFRLYFLLSIISFVISCFFVIKMPKTVPIHWNNNDVADGFGSPYILLIISALPMIVFLLFSIFYKQKFLKNKKGEKAYAVISGGVVCFLIFISWVAILAANGLKIPVIQIVMASIGILLVLLGNYMPVVGRNSFIGVRTPWTLKNDLVWKKCQLVSGVYFVLVGVFTIVLSLFSDKLAVNILILLMLIYIVFIMIYSYFLYCKVKDKKD